MTTYTSFTRVVNTGLPTAYDIQRPLPIPPVSAPCRAAPTGTGAGYKWLYPTSSPFALTGAEVAMSQTVFIGHTGASLTVTLEPANSLLTHFPGTTTGSIHKIEFVNLAYTGYTVTYTGAGGSGFKNIGLTGADNEPGTMVPVYIRWDNVSGSTGSYTIL